MSYHKTNIFTGWGVWLVATIIYLLTIEPTASFWDCGEFIASAYKLEVGHPPGAPFFMMLARFFAMFAPTGYEATAVNVLSALCSSFTILFLFWSITHMAKKVVGAGEDGKGKTFAVMASGIIGALAYTFSDSFWFSAVEGEVYAMSSLFTAVVFWAILKWESVEERGGEIRWIILIAYLMGLSIGVHLLNLLAIPAIAFVYYFKRYKSSLKGILITGVISLVILGLMQSVIVQGFVQMAGKFELFFINTLGMPFNSGVIFYALLVIGLISFSLWYSRKRGWAIVNTSVLGILMVLIGYSTFAMIVIRSSANPPMDENNPENLFTLLAYLNREQYGDRPLISGQYWNTPTDMENQYSDGSKTWVKSYSVIEQRGAVEKRVKSFRWEFDALKWIEENGAGKYEVSEEYIDSGEKRRSIPNYDDRYTTIFPRMYSTQANHIQEYKRWSNYKNYNVSRVFSSPLLPNTLMNGEEFAFHIDQNVLSGQTDAKELERNLNKLFGSYKVKLSSLIQVRAANEILIYNDRTQQFDQLANLDDERMREAVSQFIVDLLSEKVSMGKEYVDRLEETQRSMEQGLRIATARYNAMGNEDDYNKARQYQAELERLNKELQPSFGENWQFFTDFQMQWMYARYFMWNFAGRQNDIQGQGNFREGNWLSGLDFIDQERLGNRENLPSSELTNKGLNKFYYIPLLLGLIGLIFQLVRSPKEFLTVALMFVLTGIAIVVYLNQYPFQPRERDYAYVGSFYAFAIWIGLGVYALYWAAREMTWKDLGITAGLSIGAGLVFYVLENMGQREHAFSLSVMYLGGIATALFAISMLLKTLKVSDLIKAGLPAVLCLAVPYLMAADGWDDHSRAKRRTGVDFAKNYLDSLEPNAILFTNGDNDTFPLWYIQEVEGYRTDVRIVNLSLLNTDWYIDQMKRKAYESAPVPFLIEEEKYRQGTRDIVLLEESADTANAYYDLSAAMDIALDDTKTIDYGDGKYYQYLPSKSFSLPVDSAKMIELGVVSGDEVDMMVKSVDWTLTDERNRPKQYILKNHFMVLELLRSNNWERPVYFAVTTGPDSYIGLQDYFRLEGLAYRLVPIKYPKQQNPNVLGGFASDKMYENIMEKFSWGNMDDTTGAGIYMDENNRRMTTNLRLQFSNLAEQLIKEGKDNKAFNVLDKLIEVTPEKNVPYDRVMLPIVEALYDLSKSDSTDVATLNGSPMSQADCLKAQELAEQVGDRLFTLFEEDADYFLSLDGKYFDQVTDDLSILYQVNQRLQQVANFYHPESAKAKEWEERLQAIEAKIEAKERDLRDLGFTSF